MAGSTLTDPDTDQNNPGQKHWHDETSRFLNSNEERHGGSSLSDEENRQIGNLEDSYRAPSIKDGDRNTGDSGGWQTNLDKVSAARAKAQNLKNKGRMTASKRKKTLVGIGIGGGAAAIVAIVVMLLPLKLEMFIQNISKHAMAVPGYAIEHRTKYLVTHAIAARMLKMSGGAGDLVFCKNASIGCSLYKTYTTKFIENKFDLKMTVDGKTIQIDPAGRTALGGKAHTWTINMEGVTPDNIDTKLISSNKEMKAFLSDHIRTKIPDRGVEGTIKRFISRKVLMRKYGVTSWRGFEKVGAKIADIKSSLKSTIIKNTYGAISSKLAIVMGCIDDPNTCEKTLDKVDSDHEVARSLLSEDDLKKLDETAEKDVTKTLVKMLGKSSSRLVTAISAGATGVGLAITAVYTADMIISMLKVVNDGDIDKGVSAMIQGAYVAYDYGDSAGIVTNEEKLKAGDLDMNTLGVMSSMFDGAEASPLMDAENGISNVSMASLFGATANAEDGSVEQGQLVPNNMKIYQNITGTFMSDPVVQNVSSVIGPAVDAWETWVHPIINAPFDWISSALSALPPIPGVSDLIKSLTKNAMQWIISLLGFIPQLGIDEPATNNYVGLSGGLRVESNELMENGVDDDGAPNGAGGQALTSSQVAALYDTQDANTPKPSYLASLFSPYVTGSLTQQFALMMPSSGIGLMSSIMNIPATIFSGFGTTSFAATSVSAAVANNPFDQVIYGYPVGDPDLDADPNDYTPATCEISSQARENSMGKVDNKPFKVYTKTDPCALEKTVVGALLNDAGVTDDPYSLKDPVSGSSSTSSAASATIDQAHLYDDSTSVACAPGTTDAGTAQGYRNGKEINIRLCNIPSSVASLSGGTKVNSRVSGAFLAMLTAMSKDLDGGKPVRLSDSFRTMAEQQQAYAEYGSPRAALPGYSNHQMGLALDIQLPSGNDYATRPGDPVYDWLVANAKNYGIAKIPSESWHWQAAGADGSAK